MKKLLAYIPLLFLFIPFVASALIFVTLGIDKPSNIKSTSATANGTILALTGGNATVRGFAYGLTPTLTGADTATTTENGSFTAGTYTAAITGLTYNTVYYIRAYATNPSATAYSGIISFKTAVSLPKPANNLGLVAYWPMDEATSTQAGDFSGNGNTGTLSGTTKPAWTNGKRGSALSFDGSTGNVSTTDINQTDGTSKMTISFWTKPTSFSSDFFTYISKNNGTNGWSIYSDGASGLSGTNKGINFTRDGVGGTEGGTSAAGGVITPSQWNHVVVVFDETLAAPNCLQIYVNGVSQSIAYLDDGTSMCAGTTASNAALVTLGSEAAGGTDPKLTGVMDDVRIYNRALSASEVASLYAGGTTGAARLGASSKTLTNGTTLGNGLLGLWTFDGGDVRWTSATAGVAYDGSGNNNIGTLTNMSRVSSPVIGKLGQALLFPSSGTSYVDAGSASILDNLAQLSACVWVYYKGTSSGYRQIIAKTATGSTGWNMYFLDGGRRGFGFQNGVTTGPELDLTTTQMPDNEWTHLCVTWDGSSGSSGTLTYVNGSLITGSFFGTPGSFNDSAEDLYIGNGTSGFDPMNANLDDVRLYNRVLSALEVQQLYNLGKAVIMK